jgi:hypothetical protein
MTRDAGMVSTSNGWRALVGCLAAAALLSPWPVTAESSLVSGAGTAHVGATAHLDFKIVIPPVLALRIDGASLAAGAAPRVSVFSNTRHVLLTASAPSSPDDRPAAGRPRSGAAAEPRPSGAAASAALDGAHSTVLLRTGRGAVITAETACRLGGARPVATPGHPPRSPVVDLRPVVCTVAMP